MARQTTTAPRLFFIDHWRALLVTLVVLDHAVHAYSAHFADMWFLPDPARSLAADVFHLHNDSFMMPALFFVAGLFVPASLQRHGAGGFLRERTLRLMVPFVAGLPLVSPLLTYPAYVVENGALPFWRFVTTVWVTEPEVGPFWFLSYLMVLNILALVVHVMAPGAFEAGGRAMRRLMRRPALAFAVVAVVVAVVLLVADQVWGAPWWIGPNRFFRVRGSRFLVEGGGFLLGAALAAAGLLEDDRFWQRLAAGWAAWTATAVTVGAGYVAYTLLYFDTGAYGDAPRHLLAEAREFGVGWGEVFPRWWELLRATVPGVAVRTTLLGVFLLAQMLASGALCRRFLAQTSPLRASFARAAFGIYLVHEPCVVWIHWALQAAALPILVRFLIAGGGSLCASFLLVDRVLLRLPGVRRVL